MITQPNAYLLINEERIPIRYEQTTFGRLPTNSFPLTDATISKNHAVILYSKSQSKYYLKDLDSINGVWINGIRLEKGKKALLRHKDSIQFGKYPMLYTFCRNDAVPDKKGKINLKDYCYELESDGEDNLFKKQVIAPKAKQTQKAPQNDLPIKSRNSKIKIPDLAQYLQMQQSIASSLNNAQQKNIAPSKSNFTHNAEPRASIKQKRVELPKVQSNLTGKDLQSYNLHEREANLYLKQQQMKQIAQNQARSMQQQKIQLQLMKQKQQEQMLRKQLQMEKRVREQEERLGQQRRRMEEELLMKERERRNQEERQKREQQQRQNQMLLQLQKEKEVELNAIRQKEQLLRTESELAMRHELESRKHELQIEADALTKQYEHIYKETLAKLRTDIQAEQESITTMEQQIAVMTGEQSDMENRLGELTSSTSKERQDLMHVIGRNKAFILYASEIQQKVDLLKKKREESNNGGNSNQTKKNTSYRQLKEDVLNSRKLLMAKKKENDALEEDIKKMHLTLSLTKSPDANSQLSTILENHSAILALKNLYFQYIEQEKQIESIWESELAENAAKEERNRTLQKEIERARRELEDGLKENSSKLAEQRLHMLRNLHHMAEDRKRAAKLLLEESLSHQAEIRQIRHSIEQTHSSIHSLIIQSQRLRSQNTYISSMLFPTSTLHHFDNMKLQINELVELIALQRQSDRARNIMSGMESISKLQMKIWEQNRKLSETKEIAKSQEIGRQVLQADKNPLVFFGEVLTTKEMQIDEQQSKIANLQRNIAQEMQAYRARQEKCQQLSEMMERYRRDQISKVRNHMLS